MNPLRELRRRIQRAICRHPQLIITSNDVVCSNCGRRWKGEPALIGVNVGCLMDTIAELREQSEAFRRSASEFARALGEVRPTIPEPSVN